MPAAPARESGEEGLALSRLRSCKPVWDFDLNICLFFVVVVNFQAVCLRLSSRATDLGHFIQCSVNSEGALWGPEASGGPVSCLRLL